MPSLIEKFAELEKLLLNHRGSLMLNAGVPFVLLVYDPEQEIQCRQEQAHLMTKLTDNNITVREVSLENFVFDHYQELGLLDKIFEKEVTNPSSVYRDIAKHYRPALVKRLIGINDELKDQDAIIFLTSVAHLYPFVRVSNLLEDLENMVTLPLVAFYPGEELDGELRFLCLENSDGPHSKYRARRI